MGAGAYLQGIVLWCPNTPPGGRLQGVTLWCPNARHPWLPSKWNKQQLERAAVAACLHAWHRPAAEHSLARPCGPATPAGSPRRAVCSSWALCFARPSSSQVGCGPAWNPIMCFRRYFCASRLRPPPLPPGPSAEGAHAGIGIEQPGLVNSVLEAQVRGEGPAARAARQAEAAAGRQGTRADLLLLSGRVACGQHRSGL